MQIKIVGAGRVSAEKFGPSTASGLVFDENRRTAVGPIASDFSEHYRKLETTHPKVADYDPAVRHALVAAEMAVVGAGWEKSNFDILVGCSRGPTSNWETAHTRHATGQELRPQTSPLTTLGSVGFALADYFGQDGLAGAQSVTCSSGFHAILHAVALLRSGMSGRVLAGGAEAPLTDFTLAQLEAMRILNRQTGELAARPLSTPARGMNVGEGAALFALTTAPNVVGRAELIGIGFGREKVDSLSGITHNGLALQRSMRAALQEADSLPDIVIPHAPGTRAGDAAEVRALKEVFGGEMPAIFTGKWATGHTFGASGPLALELALRLMEKDDMPAMPYALGYDLRESETPPRSVLINATGFGGNAVSVIVRKG